MKLVLIVILVLYMAVNLLAIFQNVELRKVKIKTGAYILASFFVAAACVAAWKSNIMGVIPCIAGLMIYAVCAVHNGYKLHGRPNWKHHMIRCACSLVIAVLYVVIIL